MDHGVIVTSLIIEYGDALDHHDFSDCALKMSHEFLNAPNVTSGSAKIDFFGTLFISWRTKSRHSTSLDSNKIEIFLLLSYPLKKGSSSILKIGKGVIK